MKRHRIVTQPQEVEPGHARSQPLPQPNQPILPHRLPLPPPPLPQPHHRFDQIRQPVWRRRRKTPLPPTRQHLVRQRPKVSHPHAVVRQQATCQFLRLIPKNHLPVIHQCRSKHTPHPSPQPLKAKRWNGVGEREKGRGEPSCVCLLMHSSITALQRERAWSRAQDVQVAALLLGVTPRSILD